MSVIPSDKFGLRFCALLDVLLGASPSVVIAGLSLAPINTRSSEYIFDRIKSCLHAIAAAT
jgi:hypothetical protein